jgi:hypothetical protein
VRFWLTNLALVQVGVLFLWLANGAGDSILVAILSHAGFNASGGLVPASATRDLVAFPVLTVMTLCVLAVTRGRLRYAVGSATTRGTVEVGIEEPARALRQPS